jgi:hypothetical protein
MLRSLPSSRRSAYSASTYWERTSSATEGTRARIAGRGPQAFVAVARWQADVDQGEVRQGPLDQIEQLLRARHLADNVEAGLAQDPIETFADEQRVLSERHARRPS